MQSKQRGVADAAATDGPLVVGPASYLTLHYRLGAFGQAIAGEAADDGTNADVVSTFDTRPATLQLGGGQWSPALEDQLIGLEVGSHRVFMLPAGVAFGPRNPGLVQRVSRAVLEAESDRSDYSPGDVVEFNAPRGGRYAGVFQSLGEEHAIFDFNHPLAGKPVRFEVLILGIL